MDLSDTGASAPSCALQLPVYRINEVAVTKMENMEKGSEKRGGATRWRNVQENMLKKS